MIKIKSRIVETDGTEQCIRVDKYKAKNTSVAEHICVINTLMASILDMDDSMNLNKLCKIIKENQKYIMNKEEN